MITLNLSNTTSYSSLESLHKVARGEPEWGNAQNTEPEQPVETIQQAELEKLIPDSSDIRGDLEMEIMEETVVGHEAPETFDSPIKTPIETPMKTLVNPPPMKLIKPDPNDFDLGEYEDVVKLSDSHPSKSENQRREDLVKAKTQMEARVLLRKQQIETSKSHRLLSFKENKTCTPQKFVFLKNHKAGSTTIKDLLRYFQAKQEFKMTLQRNGPGQWLGGYPGVFNSEFYESFDKTDVIYDHLRWDWEQIKKVLVANENSKFDQKRIAIVREPFSSFKSSYNFFYAAHGEKSMLSLRKKYSDSCTGSPYFNVAKGEMGVSPGNMIDRLKTMPEGTLNKYPWYFRLNNSQAYDFNYIKNIPENFEHVLVLERFQESLVILKETLCMDWADIVPWGSTAAAKTKNKAHYRKSVSEEELSVEQRKYLDKHLINLDLEIYEQANKMLDERIEKYGKNRMESDIKKYFDIAAKPEFPEGFLNTATKSQHFWKSVDLAEMKGYRENNGGGCFD